MNSLCQHFLSLRKCVQQTPDTHAHTHTLTHKVRLAANNKKCLTSLSALLISVSGLCCFCESHSLRAVLIFAVCIHKVSSSTPHNWKLSCDNVWFKLGEVLFDHLLHCFCFYKVWCLWHCGSPHPQSLFLSLSSFLTSPAPILLHVASSFSPPLHSFLQQTSNGVAQCLCFGFCIPRWQCARVRDTKGFGAAIDFEVLLWCFAAFCKTHPPNLVCTVASLPSLLHLLETSCSNCSLPKLPKIVSAPRPPKL